MNARRVLRGMAVWTSRLLVAGVLLAIALFGGAYAVIGVHGDGTASLPADCAVVFGAAIYGYNTPSPAITRRTAAAADLYRAGEINRLILSGGKGTGGRISEAEVMRDLALERGVRAEDIVLEPASHSTWENLQNARNLTSDCSSVVGISDQYHLARIELLAWRQGWSELQTVPAQDRPPVGSERRSVVREVFALIYYAFYLDTFIPKPTQWFQ